MGAEGKARLAEEGSHAAEQRLPQRRIRSERRLIGLGCERHIGESDAPAAGEADGVEGSHLVGRGRGRSGYATRRLVDEIQISSRDPCLRSSYSSRVISTILIIISAIPTVIACHRNNPHHHISIPDKFSTHIIPSLTPSSLDHISRHPSSLHHHPCHNPFTHAIRIHHPSQHHTFIIPHFKIPLLKSSSLHQTSSLHPLTSFLPQS